MGNKMKETGISYIPLIPVEWEVRKIRHLTSFVYRGITPNYIENESKPMVVNQATFSKGVWDISKVRYTETTLNGCRGRLKCNDVLIASTGGGVLGKTYYLTENEENYIADSHVTIIRPNEKLDSKYIYYFLFNSYDMINDLLAKGSTNQTELQRELLLKLEIPTPQIDEQRKISKYLDSKIPKIENVINVLVKEIEILENAKISMITEGVTLGIKAESGVRIEKLDYADKVSEKWKITRIKYFCSMESGKNLVSEVIESEGEYPVYGGNGFRGYYYNYTNEGEHVLVGRQGALCGNVHIVSGKFWATDHAVVTYPTEQIDNRFLYYLFVAIDFNKYSETAAQPGLSVKKIINVHVCIPDTIDEQKEIVAFLDKKCNSYDNIIAAKRKQIEILKNQERSIIYDYVTGVKRV